jgi:hypothetical protein
MSHRHPLGAHIAVGSVATVTFGPRWGGRVRHGRLRKNVPGLFSRGPEDQALQPCDRRVLFLDQFHHPLQRPQQTRHLLINGSGQERLQARQQRRQLRGVQTGHFNGVLLPVG